MFAVSRKFVLGCSAALAALTLATGAYAQQRSFNVPSQEAVRAIPEFARQAGIQIIAPSAQLRGIRTPAVQGDLDTRAALAILLQGTGLEIATDNGSVIVLRRSDGQRDRGSDAQAEEFVSLPEVLVEGSRSLNADIRRSEDDTQPYVVFDRDAIERSLATNVEDLLTTRLPMNGTRGTTSRNYAGTTDGNRSSFNLRGLGSNQTLILVNGRRVPGVQSDRGTDLSQPDVNGIPIAAIERIEVLPTTASGIYGGGATGGVINIILRKDYQGSSAQLSYDNSFDTDSARRRLDANTGFALEDGRTQVMLSASYSDANDLLAGDRSFASRARAAALANDPAGFGARLPISNRTNFRSVDGTNLTLVNGVSLGTMFGSVPVGYEGGDNGAGLIGGAGAYDLSLPDTIAGTRQSLASAPTTQALTLTVRREMSSSVDAYVDVGATRNESLIRFSGAPSEYLLFPGDVGNPFDNIISFSTPAGDFEAGSTATSDTFRVNTGLIITLPAQWSAGLDVNWGQSTNQYEQTYGTYDRWAIGDAFAAGSLNPFRDLELAPLDLSPFLLPEVTDYGPSKVNNIEYSFRLAGPVFTLPAGDVRLSGLASFRREQAGSTIEPAGSEYAFYPERHQDITSMYVESNVPVVSPSQDVPFIRALSLQSSVRWDRYEMDSVATGQVLMLPSPGSPIPQFDRTTTAFDSFDYTMGVRLEPIDNLAIRASYATGFLPPALAQISSLYIDAGFGYVSDPKRGGGMQTSFPTAMIVAGNPDVRPEESESFSIGAVYYAPSFSGLRFSVDYTEIRKANEIVTLTQQDIVDLEDVVPGRVARGPVGASDPPGYAGPITLIDTSVINIAASRVEAFDFQVDYEHDYGDAGRLRLYAVGTLQTALERQVLPTTPVEDRVGDLNGPLRWRGNLGLVWEKGSWSVAANTQFYDRYKVYDASWGSETAAYLTLLQGSEYVDAQSYTDISARYSFDSGPLAGTQVSVGVRNVFDQSPPVIATSEASGGYSTYADPRLRTYAVTIQRAF